MKLLNKTVKLATLFAALLCLAVVVAGSFFVYWAYTGKDVIQLTVDPIPVKPKFLKAEEDITLTASFCKLVDSKGRSTQSFVSATDRVFVPTTSEPTGKGCYKDLPIRVPIPATLPPGKYHINYRIIYNTNPLHQGIVEEINSEEFTVVK